MRPSAEGIKTTETAQRKGACLGPLLGMNYESNLNTN